MQTPENRFKRRLKNGETLIGLWAQTGHATISEVVADAGFDWLLIDGEHAPLEVPTIIDQLRVIEPSGTPAIVRPAWNDPVILKRVLDTGVQTLLVPFVQTAEEARRAVASCRYPPAGTRGVAATIRANRYGRIADYHGRANDEICILVQLETGEAVGRLEEIASVDGVDGLFIGPSDLAASLGYLGQNAHPDVRALIADACRRARAVNTPIGILAPVDADARAFLEMGFQYVAVGSDVAVLRKAVTELRSRFATKPSAE
jgi:4-hydroxy-2-oxoheptanedioate aldolase